jgi:hypothetical protein
MEEHLWAEESLVRNIDLYWLGSIRWLMQVLFVLIAQIPFAIITFFFFVELLVFLGNVLSDITVLLLDLHGDLEGVLRWHGLLSVSQHV